MLISSLHIIHEYFSSYGLGKTFSGIVCDLYSIGITFVCNITLNFQGSRKGNFYLKTSDISFVFAQDIAYGY